MTDTPQRTSTPSRHPGRAVWLFLVLGTALGLATWWLTHATSHHPYTPAVVLDTGRDAALLVATNGAVPAGQSPTIAVLDATGHVTPIPLTTPHAPWFTSALRVGNHAYLADAGNDRVVTLDLPTRRVLRLIPVAGGAAGLLLLDPRAAGNPDLSFQGMREDRVLCSTATGTLYDVGRDLGAVARLRPAGTPEPTRPVNAEVIEGLAQRGDTLYATQHLRGEVALLDARTLSLRGVATHVGVPVALAALDDGVLVLDRGLAAGPGRLLWLSRSGVVTRQVTLGGHPDRLVVWRHWAFVGDRSGVVTRVEVQSGARMRRRFRRLLDLALVGDGHLVVVAGEGGVTEVDAALDIVRQYGN